MQRQCPGHPCEEQHTHSGGSARTNRENGVAVDCRSPSLAGTEGHTTPWLAPNPQGRAPCEDQSSQAWSSTHARYLQGLRRRRHHLGVWREEAVHGSGEEPGQVSPAQVLLQPGAETRQVRDRAAASPPAQPQPLPAPAQVDVCPLHGGQPGQQWLQVTCAGHVVVESLGKQKVGGYCGTVSTIPHAPHQHPILTVMIWALSSAGRQATLAWALKRLWKACMAHAVTSCEGQGIRRGAAPQQVAPPHTPASPTPKQALPGEAQCCCDCTPFSAPLIHSRQASKCHLPWAPLCLHPLFPGS